MVNLLTGALALMARGEDFNGIEIVVINYDPHYEFQKIAVVLDRSGALASHHFAVVDGCFRDSTFAADFLSEVEDFAPDLKRSGAKIVEIAGGGNVFKARYDNGVLISAIVDWAGGIELHRKNDILKTTASADYEYTGAYYKSGPGTMPLIPLFGDKGFVSVFEHSGGNTEIKAEEMIGGYDYDSIPDGVDIHARTPELIMEDSEGRFDGPPPKQCTYLPASHKAYADIHVKIGKHSWVGFGQGTGVVAVGDMWYTCRLMVPYPQKYPIKHVGRGPKGFRENVITLDGVELIEHLYTKDMSNTIVLGTANAKNFTPYEINGLFFSYADSRMTDIDLSSL